MKRPSLRLRLLAGAALWIGLALLVAGLSIGYLFVTNVERGVRTDLTATLNRLVALINPAVSPPVLQQPLADPRYDTPLSGLYWQVEDLGRGTISRSRSLWDFVLDAGPRQQSLSGEALLTLAGPDGQSLSALVREVRFTLGDVERPYRVIVAEDRAVLDESIARFGRELAIALLVLGVALIAAGWLQVRLGLRPLQYVREGIETIRRGEAVRLPETYPVEVLPLVGEVNELLATQEKSIEFARARAADLAHGLKTPLSVLETMAEQLRSKGDQESAKVLDQLMHEMADRIDYQLRLSRLRLRTGAHLLHSSLNGALHRTVEVLKRTRDGEDKFWDMEVEDDLYVDIDQHDLIELVGNLLENAAKWARTRISVAAVRSGQTAEVTIADDGPGLEPDQIAGLGVRGQRLDQSQRGSGLGLAIAKEIVALNGGTLAFGQATGGGLKVSLSLPLAPANGS